MANSEHLALFKQGVEQWNEWRKQQPNVNPDLSGANLRGDNWGGINLRNADLHGTFLSVTNLSKANLNHANLDGSDLDSAYLVGADLRGASLSYANLTSANLYRANLKGANLYNANLRAAILKGASLHRTVVWRTILAEIDLSEVKGFIEIDHSGPSRVELHTVQLPQDESALHFLRSCGVPDEWIDFYRSTMMHPIQDHSCFISYSSKDEILARRLHADLQAQGVRCWFAPEDMKIGNKIRERIDEAIHMQDKLLLLLSEHSIASAWVENEVEAAWEKEDRQKREVLFPVRLDETVMQTSRAWAATLRRTRHIGDFTHWTDRQAYEHAFSRLLRDLKREGE